jgi:hypothetical protein
MDVGMFTLLGVKGDDGVRIKHLIDAELLKKAESLRASEKPPASIPL